MYKRKDAGSPGFNPATKPRLMNLEENGLIHNGLIDLCRLDADGNVVQRPSNNSERFREKKIPLAELEYRPGEILENLKKFTGQHVEVIMPRERLLNSSKVVKKRSIWGTDVYTADSDLFTVLIHQGYIPHNVSEPGFHWPEPAKELRAILKVVPAQNHYYSCSRNTMKSRAWAASCFSCSYSVERLWVVTTSDINVELHSMREVGGHEPILPSFLLSQWDQRMSTRAVANNSERRKRQQSDVATIMYNLVNEPWLKYTSTLMADRNFGHEAWTCFRFRSEVLYLETQSERFELSKKNTVNGDAASVTYALRKCKSLLPQDIMLATGIPLPSDMAVIVHDHIEWEDILWGTGTVVIRHPVEPASKGPVDSLTTYAILRVHWLPIGRPFPSQGS